jgi:hypothetical protein
VTFHSLFMWTAVALMWVAAVACETQPTGSGPADLFQLQTVKADGRTLATASLNEDVAVDARFTISFSSPMDTVTARAAIRIIPSGVAQPVPASITFTEGGRVALIQAHSGLGYLTSYSLTITDALRGAKRQPFPGLSLAFRTRNGELSLMDARLGTTNILAGGQPRNVAATTPFTFTFSHPLPISGADAHVRFVPAVAFQTELSADRKTLTVRVQDTYQSYTRYTVSVANSLTSDAGFSFPGFSRIVVSGLDPSPKFAWLDDEALMTAVQQATFRYFWDFGHPVSGLSRERNSSGDLVTIGGSGFGVMGIIVGIHRGFITRQQGVSRLRTIVDFLAGADRFRGAWPHWMSGTTGKTIPFSARDDGGDLVETSFMAQGLLTARQYLDAADPVESELITRINALLDTIEWTWYTRGGQNVLYWHWSATQGWAMNMQVRGYNEALITYVMAATSKNHAIQPSVYTQGWAANGGIRNGRTFYGIPLPVGFDYGGPLFFAHYSFLGLDPRRVSDTYADYWIQNRNHSLIHYEHGVRNPQGHVGYSADAWGLTASDDPSGYRVHEPTNDNGTITPTAALSSIPFTPLESLRAMSHFYHILGDKLWGPYGFYDAYNPNQGWWASSYLAIDQGPILIMIENHRSGLLWDLFMSAPEVAPALQSLGFTVTSTPSMP